jgi:hypothetical protein
MISLVKHVLSEYCTLLMKITLNAPTIASTKSNLCLLTDVKMLLRLNAIMPLLEVVHSLIKFSQLHNVFVCDFIATMKICELGMYIRCIVTTNIISKVMCFEISMPLSILLMKA